MAVSVGECDVARAKPVPAGIASGIDILPARNLRDNLAITVQQVQQRMQVLSDRRQQLRAVELRRENNERAVADNVIRQYASLGKLSIGINIDAFAQPPVDSLDVTRIGE